MMLLHNIGVAHTCSIQVFWKLDFFITEGAVMFKKLLIYICIFFFKMLFRLRYKITYTGLEEVHKVLAKRKNGVVFLPNHPAIFIDPLVACFPILNRYETRPLVTEYMYYNPVLHWVMRLVHALPVPNFATGVNPLKFSRLETTLQKVESGLNKGEAFLIFPSGMTKAGPREILGGTFAVHQLLHASPETEVVLCRMTGLWGSRFSRAYTKGKQIDSKKAVLDSLKDLLKAGLFFLPRRRVQVEFEVVSLDMPRTGTKQEINKYLEEWYNGPFKEVPTRGEPLSIVPYSLWSKDEKIVEIQEEQVLEGKEIPEEVQREIKGKVAELANISENTITSSQHLVADLCLDSLNVAELITFLESRYESKQIDPESLTTVAHLFLAATNQLESTVAKEHEWDTTSWELLRKPEQVLLGGGKNIPEVFFDRCDRSLFDIIAMDPAVGPVSYHFFKSRVLLLSHELAKLPGERIGIVLPSSVGATILVLACQVAGKTPVMINWTVGGRHLESVLALSKIEVALTSWSFLDRLDNVDLTPIQDILVVLEELKASFSWWKMVTSPVKALIPTRWLRRLLWIGDFSKIQPDAEAVVLFTSGTESMPKGVPLTHYNLLSNMRSALQAINFYSSDRILSALPPFHSFGFTVTGLLPILAGLRAVFYPNPTDSGAQALAIRTWGVTIVCSAPSFLVNVLRQGISEPFHQVRVVIAGAEKAPPALFELARTVSSQAEIWEGYGITECSPVLTINSTNDTEMGVGRPLPGVHLSIVHQEDYSIVLDEGEAGMILARGPSIFGGYLQNDVKSPFYHQDGLSWYVTGDIGYLNKKGALVITGRLKRFVKIGGEMISLGAVESALAEESCDECHEGPQLAVCAQGEEKGRPRLVLFSTKEWSTTDVNAMLRQKGFANLVRIDRIISMDEIPLSGTGKVAYRQLETRVF